jgi:hypothetical protein
MHGQGRQQELDQAAALGATQVEGWRVSTKGTRFKIRNAKLFNVLEMDGGSLPATAACVMASTAAALCVDGMRHFAGTRPMTDAALFVILLTQAAKICPYIQQ